ncbi:MAG: hypothetical protein IJ861_06380 [Clostridia bacterium]|nr:hypothetical protein [Clostridia bacterium]
MTKRTYKLISVIFAAALIFCMNVTAFAAELSSGSVQGLPEKLVVLDDKGQSVSENGEYYFQVENMQVGETYTKKIQLMNLREDADYRITFRAQPLTKSGEIDLENECSCEIFLDDKMVYGGKVTGEGTPDIRDNALDLGLYRPGESHVLKVNVKWNGTSAGGFIDNGQRVITNSGIEITRERSGQTEIAGETTFKWIFYAQVEDAHGDGSEITTVSEQSDPPSEPGSGTEKSYPDISDYSGSSELTPNSSGGNGILDFVQTGDVVAWAAIIIIMAATLLLCLLLIGKRKKTKK